MSILNSIVSVLPLVALSIIIKVAGSSANFSRKYSTIFLPLISLLARIYESIFKKCDLPLPKNPEIQTPISSVGSVIASS